MSRPALLPLLLTLSATLGLALGETAALAGSTSSPPASGATTATSPAERAGRNPDNPAAASAPGSTTPSLGAAFGPSSPAQIALVEHLRARGVIFYGAFWCQHCFRQKVLFGEQAGNLLPYVECAKDEAGARTCAAAGVMAYPTWVMGNERKVGVQTLQELATWTQYQGPTGFIAPRSGS